MKLCKANNNKHFEIPPSQKFVNVYTIVVSDWLFRFVTTRFSVILVPGKDRKRTTEFKAANPHSYQSQVQEHKMNPTLKFFFVNLQKVKPNKSQLQQRQLKPSPPQRNPLGCGFVKSTTGIHFYTNIAGIFKMLTKNSSGVYFVEHSPTGPSQVAAGADSQYQFEAKIEICSTLL